MFDCFPLAIRSSYARWKGDDAKSRHIANVFLAPVVTPVTLSLHALYVDDGTMVEVDASDPLFMRFYVDDAMVVVEVRGFHDGRRLRCAIRVSRI